MNFIWWLPAEIPAPAAYCFAEVIHEGIDDWKLDQGEEGLDEQALCGVDAEGAHAFEADHHLRDKRGKTDHGQVKIRDRN